MGTKLVRIKVAEKNPSWGIWDGDQIKVLAGAADSLRDFLVAGGVAARAVERTISVAEATFLSPVTEEAQILCQGKNYLAHLLETGVKPENKEFNLIFTKASSSLAPPIGEVRRPTRVKLLDYELELGLVLKERVHEFTKITKENLHKYVAGMVMANDLSARDVQVPERQWFKGKSFRGFCPVGPILYLLDKEEVAEIYNLDLLLTVNGAVRQKANTKQLMHSPEDTLTELSGILDLKPGDLLLTGTPGGVAMRVEKSFWSDIKSKFQSEREKMEGFLAKQRQSPRYLQNQDRIESTIRSPNGKIDLGRQNLLITEDDGV